MARDGANKVELVDLITALGDQIREAQKRALAKSDKPLLKLKDCSIQLGLTWDKKANGELNVWVLKLGGEVTKENTETITINLEPIDANIPLAEYLIEGAGTRKKDVVSSKRR
jgi:Trypsin-co-occurring domain 2